MMATKRDVLQDLESGKGCLGRARLDEPVFVLRAQDRFAPELIEIWASKVETLRGTTTEKVKRARALAHEMRAWQVMNISKVPD